MDKITKISPGQVEVIPLRIEKDVNEKDVQIYDSQKKTIYDHHRVKREQMNLEDQLRSIDLTIELSKLEKDLKQRTEKIKEGLERLDLIERELNKV